MTTTKEIVDYSDAIVGLRKLLLNSMACCLKYSSIRMVCAHHLTMKIFFL